MLLASHEEPSPTLDGSSTPRTVALVEDLRLHRLACDVAGRVGARVGRDKRGRAPEVRGSAQRPRPRAREHRAVGALGGRVFLHRLDEGGDREVLVGVRLCKLAKDGELRLARHGVNDLFGEAYQESRC